MGDRRIVSTGQMSPLAVEILGRFGRIEVAPKTDEESLILLMRGTIALFVRGVTKVSASVIESGHELQVIGRTGTGYDNIDIAAATKRGIPVVFTPGAGARSVAEGTMAMILSLVKRLPELDRKTRSGDWDARDKTVIGDMQGSVLGIIGLGRIGREVAHLAQAFDMRVIAYDPGIPKEVVESSGVEPVELNELLKNSDIISIHAPLNDGTRGLFDRRCLGLVKKGAIVVNLARGGLMDGLDVVYEGLNSGRLSAVGLDVYPVEPPDTSHPIFRHPNVLLSPHAMGLSVKSAEAIFSMASKGMAEVLEGRIPTNVVNPEVFQSTSRGNALP
jgi:D-3-phosphoglycerate dehydrogenase